MKEFEFKGFHDIPSTCGIDLYYHENKVVVILTELSTNHGTSVDNAVELIAEQLYSDFNLKGKNVVWIEHYPEQLDPYNDRVLHEDTFDLVEMVEEDGIFYEPQWKRLSRIDLAKLLVE